MICVYLIIIGGIPRIDQCLIVCCGNPRFVCIFHCVGGISRYGLSLNCNGGTP